MKPLSEWTEKELWGQLWPTVNDPPPGEQEVKTNNGG